MTETVFQRALRAVGEWDGQGSPPERAIVQTERVSALLDPFTPHRFGGTVIFPHLATDQLVRLSPDLRAELDWVKHAVGGRLLSAAQAEYGEEEAEGLRVLERVDGFQVPNHAHAVLGVSARGESREDRPSVEELDRTWELLRFGPEETKGLAEQVRRIGIAARVIVGEGSTVDAITLRNVAESARMENMRPPL